MKKVVLTGLCVIILAISCAVTVKFLNKTLTTALQERMSMYTLPELPYAYNALEPYIEKEIMELHHKKHQQAYVDGLNAALQKHPELFKVPLKQLLTDLQAVPNDIRTAVQNHGGGVENHTFFWNCMQPEGQEQPEGALKDAIVKAFGSVDAFKEQFDQAAKSRFGSGWAWLVMDKKGALAIESTANQDTPLSEGLTPLLGLDVWEHAYYLQYFNRRMDYVAAWWHVVNWRFVELNYQKALSQN